MTSQELYVEMKVLLNKNGRFTNVDYPKSNFVMLYNREQRRWYSQTISKKKDSDDIVDIESLLVTSKLEFVETANNTSSYLLPVDWFKLELFEVTATKGCTKRINARPVNRVKNINEILADEFSSPSFEWEETVYRISDGKVFLYFSDFDISTVTAHFYKKLSNIDMSGYIKLDGSASTDINQDLDDIYQEQILDRVVLEIQGEIENQVGMQVANQRIATQERIAF